ncbi:MAG: hypothetical protein ACXABO_16200 [Promethearchaeota archaeon]
MEKTEQTVSIISEPTKKEINWADYLDYTKFFEPAEINNISLELFIKDCEYR